LHNIFKISKWTEEEEEVAAIEEVPVEEAEEE
jgi:hypothetical protein